jgi:DNA (cytosine-5)-methyltransferase 1
MTLTYGSVCSGIEAASVAWEPIGYVPLRFSEIEKFPSDVLKYHYPNVPIFGDMTLIAKSVRDGTVQAPDVLVGGTPCQAFSVAGLRGGLSDARGQLTLSYVDLLNAIDEKRNTSAIAVWENVPGVLSSKDNAFGCFLAGLAGESEPLQPTGKRWANAGYIIGPSRRIAWRILDAQYFGVAQRRRRLFVVASARDDFDPLQCLFEFDSTRRDTPPSREAGEEIAAFTPSSFGDRGVNCDQIATFASADLSNFKASNIAGTLRSAGGDLGGGSENLALTLTTSQERNVPETQTFVTYALAENIIGRQPHNGGNGDGYGEEIGYTLNATGVHGVVLPINTMVMMGRPSDDLNPRMGLGIGKNGEPQNTLTKAHNHAVAYTLHNQMYVRRLLPVECERLQGFPDNYTNIPKAKDGPRYKALGNSMAVPVMRWIGVRVLLHHLGIEI